MKNALDLNSAVIIDNLNKRNFLLGCFFGSIVGDALGAPVEFKPRKWLMRNPVKDMDLKNHNFKDLVLEPGSWTDDTSLTLCLAKSLIEKGFDETDQLEKYISWWKNGYLSVNDVCFDIGNTTKRALQKFYNSKYSKNKIKITDESNSQSEWDVAYGNGSLMRLSVIPIYIYQNNGSLLDCIQMCAKSSATTHDSVLCQDACKILGGIIWLILHKTKKNDLFKELQKVLNKKNIHPDLHDIIDQTFLLKENIHVKSTGYVLDSLECALYCFFKCENYNDSVLMAVNMGNDTDTNACICGTMSGAYYGFNDINVKWINTLQKPELLWDTIKLLLRKS